LTSDKRPPQARGRWASPRKVCRAFGADCYSEEVSTAWIAWSASHSSAWSYDDAEKWLADEAIRALLPDPE
jgi:hypothetical protein